MAKWQVTLARGEVTTVTVNILTGSPVPQGSVPRVAVEGDAGTQLLGGVVLDVIVPNYTPFLGQRVYLPLVRNHGTFNPVPSRALPRIERCRCR